MRKSELEKIKIKKEIEKIEREILQMDHTKQFQEKMSLIAFLSFLFTVIGSVIGGIFKILGYKF